MSNCSWCGFSGTNIFWDIGDKREHFCSSSCVSKFWKSILIGGERSTTYTKSHQKYYQKNFKKLNAARAEAYRNKHKH